MLYTIGAGGRGVLEGCQIGDSTSQLQWQSERYSEEIIIKVQVGGMWA